MIKPQIINPETREPTTTSAESMNNLNALRLPTNYGANLGVKKLLSIIPVCKPRKNQFFRTNQSAEMKFPTTILELKEIGETYVVTPDVAQNISELVRPVELFAAIDRQNNVFLIPVPLPDESGNRNQWHESLLAAIENSKKNWTKISANRHINGYDILEAQAVLPEPEWPDYGIDKLVETAFRGKIISDLDHTVVQSLLGRI